MFMDDALPLLIVLSYSTMFCYIKNEKLLSSISISIFAVFIMASRVEAAGLKTVEWRWLSGASIINQVASCSSSGQFSTAYSPGGRNQAAITTAYNGHIYMFGGDGYSTVGGVGFLGDVWVYVQPCASCTGAWAWLGGKSDSTNYQGYYTGSTPYPGARQISAAWFTPPNKLHVHGGHGYDGVPSAAGYLSDLWTFNTDTYAWTFLKGLSIVNQAAVYGTKGTPAAGNVPGGIAHHMVLTSKSDGTAIIFGGDGYITAAVGKLSDTWKYTSGIQWTWINGPSTIDQNSVGGSSGVYASTYYPGGRRSCALMDASHRAGSDLVYLYGGYGYTSTTGTGNLGDLWAFNAATNEWAYRVGESSAVEAVGSYGTMGYFGASNHPGSSRYPIGNADPNSSDLIVLFGGYGHGQTATEGYLNDFWVFNTTTKQWSWASGNSVIDQNGNYADSVWFSSANKPGGRYGHSASVNTDFGLMYVFGGHGYPVSGGVGKLNDFWTTRGPIIDVGISPTASPVPTPTTTPSPVPTPVAVLKPVEWRWLSGSSVKNQNGVCGTAGQYSETYVPGGRKSSTMTRKAYNGQTYVFGGLGYTTTGLLGHLGDVWVYRQTEWSAKGQWAWLGGLNNETGYQGYYAGFTPFPGGRGMPIAWYKSPNLLYVHGGEGIDGVPTGAGKLSDLWSFNTDTFVWTFLKGSSVISQLAVYGTKGTPAAGNVPGAVYNHMVLASKSDGTAIIFGGNGFDSIGTGYQADVWKYSNDWAWMNGPKDGNQNGVAGSPGAYSSTYYPGGRQEFAAMDGTHSSDYAYVYGGYGFSTSSAFGLLADLWAYNTVTYEWAFIAGESSAIDTSALASYGLISTFIATNHPSSRRYVAGYTDPNSDLVGIIGGYGTTDLTSIGYLNDFWAFNVTTRLWSWASGDAYKDPAGIYADSSWFTNTNKPGGRQQSTESMDYDLGLLYEFGGYGWPAAGVKGYLNDFWATRGPTIIVGASPTVSPTASPTSTPTASPMSSPTASPTSSPTASPMSSPTASPTSSPIASPTSSPTASPTTSPTASPTSLPTVSPTNSPTPSPTSSPTVSPMSSPTVSPTTSPTASPTFSPGPTGLPTTSPTSTPAPSTMSGGAGSGTGSGSMDEVTTYIIIAGSALLGGIVVVFFAMSVTKRGRDALGRLFGKTKRSRVTVTGISSNQKDQMTSQQPIIIQNNYTIVQVDPNAQMGMEQQQMVSGSYAIALYDQVPDDPTQLRVSEGDVMKIEDATDQSGWIYVAVMKSDGTTEKSGYYPAQWISLMNQNPFGNEPEVEEPLCGKVE